jgi:hypothetical protein
MFAWCQWPSAAFSEMIVEKKYKGMDERQFLLAV